MNIRSHTLTARSQQRESKPRMGFTQEETTEYTARCIAARTAPRIRFELRRQRKNEDALI